MKHANEATAPTKSRRSLPERLAARRALIGIIQMLPNTALSEMAGMCGYDFIILDGEHGVFDERDYFHALQTLAATDVFALVRLGSHDPQAVGRYLDFGADGIVVPNVSTAEQARALVRAIEYPPAGTRGLAMHRATRWGLDLAAYMKAPRDRACLLLLIESALGVANIDDILAVDGVDGVFIGPFDLTADLGRPGDFTQPAYAEAVARIERAAAARDKMVGTGPHPGYPLEALAARGHRLLLLGGDVSLVRQAMTSQVTTARAAIEGEESHASQRPSG
jgi:4-hydroxy-2-oxoheptanedioate aldolase